MAKKFILVDQSIAGIAGHHYEYAVHVLRAAEEAGYEPCLVSNVAFKQSPRQIPWKCHPIYHHGFWESEGAPKFNLAAKILEIVSWLRFRWMFSHQFSLPGVLWMHRDNLTEFIGLQMLRRGKPLELAPLVLLAVLMKTLRLLAMIVLLPAAVIVFLARAVRRILKIGRFPSGYLHNLTADVRDLGRLLGKMFSQRHVWMRWLQQRRHRRGFRRDTGKMLRLIDARQGDIIFIPTLSVTELAGLAELIESSVEARSASWHLLFRRNIFLGRECDYQHQYGAVTELRQTLQVSAAKLKNADVRFYTDTEELTRQYNRLNVFGFETVPIPHTHPPASRNLARRALRILYVGDARGEKGYHLLPRIVENLWERYVEPGRVSFHIQSNFNIPLGEPRAAVARGQLEYLASKKPGCIELLKEPLTSDQYRDLLLSGDINLLLYDCDNYYARSSGILVESLSAGMPVIVPAGTWLSRQFAQEVSQWRNELVERMVVVKARRMAQLKWRVHSRAELDPVIHGELTAAHKDRTFTWIKAPAGATHLLVRLSLSSETTEALIYADQLDGNKSAVLSGPERLLEADGQGRAIVLIPLHPSAVRIWLGVSSNRAGMTVRAREVEVVFLSPRAGCDAPPASVIGAVYHDISEIPGMVEETIDNYGHYSATARRFATGWGAHHNAGELIRALEGRKKPMAAEALV